MELVCSEVHTLSGERVSYIHLWSALESNSASCSYSVLDEICRFGGRQHLARSIPGGDDRSMFDRT